ncbi:MAG: M23 family metallopeptidase [Clostridia bacterium]|nr:M23 family metallopeptidase [Clostridia bacterium]
MIRAITYFGLRTRRYARRFMRAVVRLLRKPVLAVAAWIYILFAALDFFFARSARNFRAEWRYLRKEMRSVSENLHKAWKKNTSTWLSVVGHYIFKAFRKHRRLFKAAVNTALPILMAIVLVVEIHQWQSFTYALRVIYNGQTIGYISNESVYLQARSRAVEKLSVGMDENERAEVINAPKYELSLVSINKMVDTDMLSDNLIHACDANITNACGVFIDGEFLCAVKNENDARSVFNAILDSQPTGPNATAGFMESVDYVQGLYPDNANAMWDANKLGQTLTADKRPAKYYVAQAGDSLSKIASDNHLTVSELKALNPELGDTIFIGTTFLVAEAQPYITPKITRTEVRTEEIDFKTETSYNSKLFSGDRRILRQGQKGVDKVTVNITTVRGVTVDVEEIGRVTVSEPVSEKVEIGTAKAGSAGYYGGTYSASGFMWPAPTARMISQYFGHNGHKGLDITTSGALGRPIVAAASGTVEIAGSTGNSYGQYVLIDHGNGIKTRYAHCVTGSIRVYPGKYVTAGQQIAAIGSTGNSTGPHLHFEVIVNGYVTNPLNYVSR